MKRLVYTSSCRVHGAGGSELRTEAPKGVQDAYRTVDRPPPLREIETNGSR